MPRLAIPDEPRDKGELLAEMRAFRGDDADWRSGRVFSLVYHVSDEHERFLEQAHALFASTNGLNPLAFQSLKRMEAEVISMSASMLHGPDDTVGALTSGGTESLLLAVLTYREHARKHRPWVLRPEIVVPTTIHPAFDKAAHYFGVRLTKVPVTKDLVADVARMGRAITRQTIALAASAPQYPHGVVDPIPALGELAMERGLPLHVDACVGGFMLPWAERLGRPISPWDLRVQGVTSVSADLHKYGYAGKGASVLCWRSMEWMRHQFFVATDWPGGVYASPSIPGTRPGGPIAAAWAALMAMGTGGYLDATQRALAAADALRAGIRAIPGLEVLGDSRATILAWGTAEPELDVYAIADRLEAQGWAVDRQQKPPSVHHTVAAHHAPAIPRYLADLRAAVDEVRRAPRLKREGTAAMYGLMARVPMRGLVADNIRRVMEKMYAPGVVVPDLTQAAGGDGMIGKLVDRFGPELGQLLEKLEAARAKLRRAR